MPMPMPPTLRLDEAIAVDDPSRASVITRVTRTTADPQRGAAAVAVTALLCLGALLALGTVAATTATQQRTARHAERNALAFHAAEAGLDWALAELDEPRALDDDCVPATAPGGGTPFATRLLSIDAASGAVTPVVRTAPGAAASPPQAACTRTSSGWRCICAATGASTLAPAADDQPRATFRVHFEAASAPHAVQLVADGCSQPAGDCAPTNGAVDAVAHVRTTVGLLPALVTLPSAALTVAGSAAGAAALTVRNGDASSGGVAVQAGGSIDLPHARLAGVAGAASGAERLAGDAALAALDFEHLARRLTALDTARWRQSAAVRTVVCGSECSGAIGDAVAAVPGPALLWVTGDVALSGPSTLGTPERPLLLLASGRIVLTGGVQLTGVVLGGDLVWNAGADAGAGAGSLQGALLSGSGFGGDGTPAITYSHAVLDRLKSAGRYAKVAGSWRDF